MIAFRIPSDEIFQYFVELETFLQQLAILLNDRNNLEFILRHLEDHISIIPTFLVLMSNPLQQNVAERTLCIILESLREMLAKTHQVEADIQAHGMGTDSASQRGRQR